MRAASLSVLILDLSRSRKKDTQLAEYLQEKGLQQKSVKDPKRAEEALRRGSVQIVILRVGPKGVTTLEKILRGLNKANDDVPTLVISEAPHLEESVAAIRGRAFDYLAAPCEWSDLDVAVQGAIDDKGYLRSPEERLNRTLGERLRQARVDRDLTLRQLANRTGLSVSLISQIELARSSASVATLFKLSRALKVKLGELFAGL